MPPGFTLETIRAARYNPGNPVSVNRLLPKGGRGLERSSGRGLEGVRLAGLGDSVAPSKRPSPGGPSGSKQTRVRGQPWPPLLSQIWSWGPATAAPRGPRLARAWVSALPCALSTPNKRQRKDTHQPKASTNMQHHCPVPTFPGNRQEARDGRARAGSPQYLDFLSEVLLAGQELVQCVLGMLHVTAVLPVDQEPGRWAHTQRDTETHTHRHTQRHRESQTHRDTETHKDTQRDTHRHTQIANTQGHTC